MLLCIIRTMSDEQGEPLFCGKDVAEALGYSNTKDVLLRHVDKADKLGSQITTSGQSRTMTFVNESGLYSLILSSKLLNKNILQEKLWKDTWTKMMG